MNTLRLPARLVDKNHKAYLGEIEARIEDTGVFIPIRTTLRGVVFEISRIHPGGLIVYWQAKTDRKL